MKQSNGKLNLDKTAILYVRLSRDDNQEGDSYSIQNQKKLLTKVAKEYGYINLLAFCDDGISGVTMNRPGYIEMIEAIQKRKASAVFVKDLSRLGRNYIEVGRLTEEFFPEHNIRLISVSEGLDTDNGEDDLTPFRNLFNEWYARDISKKRRISNKIKGAAGEPLGPPPYGYMKDPDNAKRWIVDDEAAEVVRRIYIMALEGLGTEQIAKALSQDHNLTPSFYWKSKGINRPCKKVEREPYKWNTSTVTRILTLQEYCGDVINFKTYSKSYKNKKRIDNDEENKAVFKDVHDPIVDRPSWEKIQQQRGTIRKRKTSDGEVSIFSGLLTCADCGHNLWFHFNQGNPEIKYFNCSNYKGNRGSCTSTHYVRVDFLEEVVLGEIRRLTRFASQYQDDFLKAVIGHSKKASDEGRQRKQRELSGLVSRDRELDNLFEKMYEDNASGKITEERYMKMSKRYEDEQRHLSVRIKELRTALEKETESSMSVETFVANIRKYSRARKLTARMLAELVDHIEVYHAQIIDGVKTQDLRIYYNCIGSIDIPDYLPLPEPDVLINTRQGVSVRYSSPKEDAKDAC